MWRRQKPESARRTILQVRRNYTGELIASVKKYHPSDDISLIEKAYRVAADAHKDQKRKSGEPYIIHPLCVAIILADLELDKESIAAGLCTTCRRYRHDRRKS